MDSSILNEIMVTYTLALFHEFHTITIGLPELSGNRVVMHSTKTKKMGVGGDHLQEEITMDILSKLPMRSLLRFKCIWMTLISDPYFTVKHLNHAKNNQNSQKFLVSQGYPLECKTLYCSYLSLVQREEEVQERDWPFSSKPMDHILLCCYDSLALIEVRNYRDYKHPILLLWNPSTRESIVLPRPKLSLEENTSTLGLGYDSTSNDYKILKIDKESHNEILALKSGSSKLMDKHPTGIHPMLMSTDSLVFVHGAFHWVGWSRRCLVISFSISDEVFREIPFPKQMISYKFLGHGISVLGEMLCAYSCYKSHTEYVKESWTELFSVQDTGLYSIVPKYRFSDGEVLLYCELLKPYSCVFKTSKEHMDYGLNLMKFRKDSFTQKVCSY